MPQLQNDGTAKIELTAEQKVIFKDFIKCLIDDDKHVNLLVPYALWNNADSKLTHKFWLCRGSYFSAYNNLSTIPLIPQLSDEIEQFFLENPEAFEGALESQESVDYVDPRHGLKSYSLLTRLPSYLQDWALMDSQRAKLVVDQPELYKHSQENLAKNDSKKEANILKLVSAYFFLSCLAFTVVAIAAFPLTAAGAAAFLFLSLGSAYLSHKANKNAKLTPLTDLANSSDAVEDSGLFNPASLAAQLILEANKDDLVAVNVSVNASSETPVNISIGPFFHRDRSASIQSNDSLLEEKSDLACR